MDGPIITSIVVMNISKTTAFVGWVTDIPSQSKVDFGTTTSYGTNVTNSSLRTVHGLTVTGLTNNTTYHFKVTSTDASGKVVASADRTFMTRSTSYKPGDVNSSGVVDDDDATILSANFGKIRTSFAQGNVDGDLQGLIDFADLAVVFSNF